MMAQWLAPVSEAEVCGPDLQYDPDFAALEASVLRPSGPEFRRDDGVSIAVDTGPIQWQWVLEQAQALLARSKDLRLAILLTRSLLHVEGFAGIAKGMELIRRLLQEHWEGVHPRLDPDDGDPTMRLNALAALSATESVLGDIRSSLLLDSRLHGRLRVRDLEAAQGRLEAAPGEARLAGPELAGLLRASRELSPELATRAVAALQDLESLSDWLAEKVGRAALPDLSPLKQLLQMVVAAMNSNAGLPNAGPNANREAGIESLGSSGMSWDGSGPDILGLLRDREDVIRLLGILCEYLEQNEPTNPVQLLLKRARRMMRMNFLELLQDMAPDGLVQAEKVVGGKYGGDD